MINEFIELSKFAGMREDLVQAGGGNSSVKISDTEMIIKASGDQLADVSASKGYSIVNYQMIQEYLKQLADGSCNISEKEILEKVLVKGERPSIETFLHAITDRVTLHVHAVAVNILASRKEGILVLEELFPDALIVDYKTPGLKLALEYYRVNRQNSSIVILKNHGLIVSGKSFEEVIRVIDSVCIKIEQRLGIDYSAYRASYKIYKMLQNAGINSPGVVVKVENHVIMDLFKKNGQRLWKYQICPDCLVYCGIKELIIADKTTSDDIRSFIKSYGIPTIIQYGEDLYIHSESIHKVREIESVLAYSAHVSGNWADFEITILPEDEQRFLISWDAEKYRKTIK